MHNKRKWQYYDIHNPLDEGKTSGEKIYVFSYKKKARRRMASGNVGNVFRRPLFLYDPPPDVNTYPPPVLRVSVSDEIRKNRKSRKNSF